MNNARRKTLSEAIDLLYKAKDIIESVKDEEQDAYDNMPGSLKGSERGEAMEEAVSVLEEQYDELDNVTDALEELL